MNHLQLLAILSFENSQIQVEDFFDSQIRDTQDVVTKFKPFEKTIDETKSWLLRQADFHLKNDIQIITPANEAYPLEFKHTPHAPLYFSHRGNLECLKSRKISVVGAREPTGDVLRWMDLYLDILVKDFNITIISGAARGVDQRAHAISLRNQKPTIAFLPSGLMQIYPADFSRWVKPIVAAGGLVLSEYLPEQKMRKFHFHERNHRIACLGELTFVAQARRASGSLVTAKHANELGKTICVLPTSTENAQGAGGLDLLYHGAQLVRDHKDFQMLLNL